MLDIEKQSGFDAYAVAVQTLLIPHSLGLFLTSEDEEKSIDDIIRSATEFIRVLTRDRGMRILKGIKTVKDSYEYINLTSIDPEIPEEYSDKVILQLTQGYLSLVSIEKDTPMHDVQDLLCDKWNAHLVGCIDLWIKNDSSPVVNVKGKILLNFLAQLFIPFEKVCSCLTDK